MITGKRVIGRRERVSGLMMVLTVTLMVLGIFMAGVQVGLKQGRKAPLVKQLGCCPWCGNKIEAQEDTRTPGTIILLRSRVPAGSEKDYKLFLYEAPLKDSKTKHGK